MSRSWLLRIGLLPGAAATLHAHAAGEWRASSAEEQSLDAAAFKGVDPAIADPGPGQWRIH